MSKRLVVGNWKMYIESPEEARAFAAALRKKGRAFNGVDVVLAPPHPLIPAVATALKGSSIKVGAQAASSFAGEKHTGEVSAPMLKQAGASFVIVGHSERRAAGESNAMVHEELRSVAAAGLTSILCVGEAERDAGGAHFSFVEAQLSSALKQIPKLSPSKLVIAYEPVWAIGKSAEDAMKPHDVREMSIFIKKTLTDMFERKIAMRVPLLYGGSVEPDNAHVLITEGNVNGFLVGHASAQLDSFMGILTRCK